MSPGAMTAENERRGDARADHRIDAGRNIRPSVIDRRGDNKMARPSRQNAWRPKMRPRAKMLHFDRRRV
jgi:hypothetical protein